VADRAAWYWVLSVSETVVLDKPVWRWMRAQHGWPRTRRSFGPGTRASNGAVAAKADQVSYLCECGDDQCFERISLTQAEYETVRGHPARFVVVDGHEDTAACEVVVEEHDGFTLVEKQGAARDLVERRDPRRR
jgi:hypothetical protein